MKTIKITMAALLMTFGLLAQESVDITDLGGTLTAQYNDSPSAEGIANLIDNSAQTKFLTFHSRAWVQYEAVGAFVLTGYSLTSANDQPARDPKSWTLTASTDGVAWDTLDVQADQNFSQRYETKNYELTGTGAYRFFRLDMTFHRTDDYGRDILQLGEMELLAVTDQPVAMFSVSRHFITEGQEVTFANESLNAQSVAWTFEGGQPAASTQEAPMVRYDSTGLYPVTLTVINGEDTSVTAMAKCINVRRTGQWDAFTFPEVRMVDNQPQSEGSQIYHALIEDPVWFNQQHCREVSKLIYYDQSQVPEFDLLEYKLDDLGNTPSYKWDVGDKAIGIAFNTSYLANIWESSQHDTNAVYYEVRGVLYHEETHGYQQAPRGCGGYQSGTDFFGFIEGLADYVRIRAGFHLTRSPGVNSQHKWNSGYTTTGFFIAWIQQEYDPNFGVELNLSAGTINPWSWDAACQTIVGKGVQELWDEYAAYLSGGGKVRVDEPDYRQFVTSNVAPSKKSASLNTPVLHQGHPNPFNNSTSIDFYLPARSRAELDVFNLRGRKVTTLVNNNLPPGHHSCQWNASGQASGIYFCRLKTRAGIQSRRLILMK